MTVSITPAIQKFAQKIFSKEEEKESFLSALQKKGNEGTTIIWTKDRTITSPFQILPARPQQPDFTDRLPIGENPGKHLLHDKGYYYCLDYSSVFAALPLLALAQHPSSIFDVCAAPGGKSVFAWRALKPKILLANEVVIGRARALITNFKRCGIAPAKVLHQRVELLAENFPECSPIVLVDAPCSGQSLLLKGQKVPGAFHSQSINGNAMRQRKIISHASHLVAGAGHLLYTTCTYSKEENEDIIVWFLKKFPEFALCKVDSLTEYQSHLTDLPCYRLWPQSGLGAGSFTALMKRSRESLDAFDTESIPAIWKNDR